MMNHNLTSTLRTNPLAFLVGPATFAVGGLVSLVYTMALVQAPALWFQSISFALFASGVLSASLLINYAWNPYADGHTVKTIGWSVMLVTGMLTWAIKIGTFDVSVAMVFVLLLGLTGVSLPYLTADGDSFPPTA